MHGCGNICENCVVCGLMWRGKDNGCMVSRWYTTLAHTHRERQEKREKREKKGRGGPFSIAWRNEQKVPRLGLSKKQVDWLDDLMIDGWGEKTSVPTINYTSSSPQAWNFVTRNAPPNWNSPPSPPPPPPPPNPGAVRVRDYSSAGYIYIYIVGNSSSQPYPANGLAIVIPTFLLRSCYYFLMKPIQSFVSHYSTGYEYSIMLSLLLSLLHVVVVIYNPPMMKKSHLW